jgi:hypothetical protein
MPTCSPSPFERKTIKTLGLASSKDQIDKPGIVASLSSKMNMKIRFPFNLSMQWILPMIIYMKLTAISTQCDDTGQAIFGD